MYARELLAIADNALLLVDPDNLQIVACNPAAEQLLGYDEAQLTTMPITDIECALPDYFFWQDVRNGARPDGYSIEGMYRRRDGSIVPVERHFSCRQHTQKPFIGISVRSVQQEKLISENLERTAAVLRATFESTSYGILVTDLDGNIVNLNRRFGEIWQLPDAILNGNEPRAIMRAMIRRIKDMAVARKWLDAIANARDFDTIDELALRNGRILSVHSRPQTTKGQIIGRVLTFEDISEQVHAQTELETAREQAERANRAKTEFLRHMSHELRTPLNAIIGFARLGLDPDHLPQRDHIEMIARAGEHLLGLINEVLDLAAVEAGRIPLAFSAVPVHSIVVDCMALVHPLLEKYQIALQPFSVSAPLWVRADQTRLRQILLNLLSNAIKYNKVHGSVSVNIDCDATTVRITVRDTGIGISVADQKMLFENFSRVGTKQGEVEGTGIGLAFSRKLARLMQGDISFSSEEHIGSAFCLELPIATSQLDATSANVVQDNVPCTVLYIEDDSLARKLVQAALKKHTQFTLWTAENGATGINMALQQRPDIVLTDMHLGDMTGYDVLRALRASDEMADTPCVMISAGVMKDEVESALEAGFDRYLTKPVQIPTLVATLGQLKRHAN